MFTDNHASLVILFPAIERNWGRSGLQSGTALGATGNSCDESGAESSEYCPATEPCGRVLYGRLNRFVIVHG